jgi:hypothetical protein
MFYNMLFELKKHHDFKRSKDVISVFELKHVSPKHFCTFLLLSTGSVLRITFYLFSYNFISAYLG